MTDLKRKLVSRIEASGPMPIAEYMAACLLDPESGYYTSRDPFGAAGDFVTAPEISQMFGELLAVWLYATWQELGSPKPVTVVELGPGRGTLFKDMARTFASLDRSFAAAASYVLIEASPRMREVQRKTLIQESVDARWHAKLSDLPAQPTLLVGNEIFDALPVHQYVKTRGGWHERCVGIGENNALRFIAGAGTVDPRLLPPEAESALEGAVAEVSPARTALMVEICRVITTRRGAGLFCDYGYDTPALGDTLQAVRKHRFDDVLGAPGEADLTAHVDFSALREVAALHGLQPQITSQGDFLVKMGLLERAGRLGQDAGAATRQNITSQVDRLAGSEEMGNLFKILAVLPQGASVHPFRDRD